MMILKVLEMFKVFDRTAFCILPRIPSPQPRNSSLINTSTSLDHPPITSMMMVCCLMVYPGYFWAISHLKEPYFAVFSSVFFCHLSIHGHNISTSFFLKSVNRASTLFCFTWLCSAYTGTYTGDCAPHILEHPRRPWPPKTHRLV